LELMMNTAGSDLPPQLSVDIQVHGRWLIVTLSGVLDLATRDDLVTTMADAVAADVQVVCVDARDLEFCDSAGLSALIGLHRRASAEGRHLYLVNPQPGVRTVLETTGLTRLTQPPLPD